MKAVRCAIYTRKSSEEGLEQDFNSLDAQREACAAYVLSQASEGWQLLPGHYDDGGLSGGTLERPALQRLLADIGEGRIDIVVVYKVDRLTRSLLDFAKLVEVLDKAGTSFVSITQSFNTTTSMGRLTLNMLLSFAQFEREVTAERIRDKIAASKARGMWMGGTPPLGYAPDGRTLVIVDEHAALVRRIYQRYLALGSVRALADEFAAAGIRAPERRYRTGNGYGGGTFTRGQLYFILKNATYAGRIVHKAKTYPGQHPAIIARDTFDKVQQMLAAHVQGARRVRQGGAVLAGKLLGPHGEPLVSAHSTRGNLRYRYYVSRDLHHHGNADGVRIPAREIEAVVFEHIAALFDDPLALLASLQIEIEPRTLGRITEEARKLAVTMRIARKHDAAMLLQQARIGPRQVILDLDAAHLANLIGSSLPPGAPATLTLTIDAALARTGQVFRLIDGDGCSAAPQLPDEPLLRMIAQARAWWAQLAQGELNVQDLAQREGVNPSRLTRILRLAFLSPAVIAATLDGTAKAGLGRFALVQADAIPASWEEQSRRYLAAPDPAGYRAIR